MSNTRAGATLFVVMAAIGCGGAGDGAAEPQMAGAGHSADEATAAQAVAPGGRCAIDPQKVEVDSENIDEGAAIVFKPKAGEQATLRRDVETYRRGLPGQLPRDQRASDPDFGPHENEEAGTGTTAQAAGTDTEQVALNSKLEEIEGGVRVVLIPADPAHLQLVREYARRRADQLARGECDAPAGMTPEQEGARELGGAVVPGEGAGTDGNKPADTDNPN